MTKRRPSPSSRCVGWTLRHTRCGKLRFAARLVIPLEPFGHRLNIHPAVNKQHLAVLPMHFIARLAYALQRFGRRLVIHPAVNKQQAGLNKVVEQLTSKVLFIHGWIKVKAMTERLERNDDACCVSDLAASGVSLCPPHAPRGRGRV